MKTAKTLGFAGSPNVPITYRPEKSCSEDLPSMIALLIMRKYRHIFENNKRINIKVKMKA